MTNTIPSDGPKALGTESPSGLDFCKFWEHFLGDSLLVTSEKLQAARQTLLDAGTPARTAMYYFIELGSMGREEDLGMVETVMYELQS
jgi:hypothetical protein